MDRSITEENRSFRVLLQARVGDLLVEKANVMKKGDQEQAALLDARIRECEFLKTYAPRTEGFWTEAEIPNKPEGQKAIEFWREGVEMAGWMLHEKEILAPFEQWTIAIDSDCGFKGEVRLRTQHLGSCALRDVHPEGETS